MTFIVGGRISYYSSERVDRLGVVIEVVNPNRVMVRFDNSEGPSEIGMFNLPYLTLINPYDLDEI